MSKKNTYKLADLVSGLTKSFERYDYILKNGCNDPFYCDGINLNLVRNHILSYKKQIEEFLEGEKTGQTSLFSSSYPDIYYKPTPEEVSYDFMVNPEGIRSRAAEQLAKYEQDTNFQYICDHYKEAFPNGETKATRNAGIYPGQFNRFVYLRKAVERDDLVEMRNRFWKSYEEQEPDLKKCANTLRAFLSMDHSPDENTPVIDDYYEEEYEDEFSVENDFNSNFDGLSAKDSAPSSRASLDEQIGAARVKAENQEKQSNKEIEEQLSLF